MTMKLYSDSDIQDIADAIRSKNGSSDTYKVSEMAQAISNIQIGYSIDQIIERSAISGDIVYTGNYGIADGMFEKTSITSFKAPYVTEVASSGVGYRAFAYCTSLVSVEIPLLANNNSNNMSYCFGGCVNLEKLHLPSIKLTGGNFCEHCDKLSDVDFSELVQVSATAFRYCRSLAHIDLPKCERINTNGFNDCRVLTAIILRHSSVVELQHINAFTNTPLRGYGGTNSGHIYVPSALISSYQTADNWSTMYANYPDIFKAIEGSIYE